MAGRLVRWWTVAGRLIKEDPNVTSASVTSEVHCKSYDLLLPIERCTSIGESMLIGCVDDLADRKLAVEGKARESTTTWRSGQYTY